MFLSYRAGHVVQGASQVVDDLTGHNGERVRVAVSERKSPDSLGAIEIEIADHLVTVSANECANRLVEIVDLGLGPVDLGLDHREMVRAYVQ